jgi:hypothetical protein
MLIRLRSNFVRSTTLKKQILNLAEKKKYDYIFQKSENPMVSGKRVKFYKQNFRHYTQITHRDKPRKKFFSGKSSKNPIGFF